MLLTWLEINRAAFAYNLTTLSYIIAPAQLMCVIKANAYGHGLQEIASLIHSYNHSLYICVAYTQEAITLRQSGITNPLLVLVHHENNFEAALEYNLMLSIAEKEDFKKLEKITEKYKKQIKVHVKIDTGMSRLGFSSAQSLEVCMQYRNHPFIEIEGVATHLYNKDQDEITSTHQQLTLFNTLITQLERQTHKKYSTHALSSGALDSADAFIYSHARIGTHLYGFKSSAVSHQRLLQKFPDYSFKPVMTWKTRIISLKNIPTGTCVGYGCTFKAHSPMKIAILPVGYSDGYPRQLSNRGTVLIHNQPVPVIGTVSMNLLIVDVTALSSIQIGDEVTLLGNYPGLMAQDMANMLTTIPIEITTRINPALKRIIV
jgi:alanine racemase